MDYYIRKSKTSSGFDLMSSASSRPKEGWKKFSSNAAREKYRLSELQKRKK